ncbi:MAG: hypothetical protein KAQ66_07890, partial [Rhodospirillaceae bacterium]|nr:hypothetical protein [Rhodospirillaceae bacterium]
VSIELSPDAREWLAKKGFDARFGARPLGRIIQEHIKRPLSEELLFGRLTDGGLVRVEVADGKISFSYPETPKNSGKKTKSKKPKKQKGGLPTTKRSSGVPAVVK